MDLRAPGVRAARFPPRPGPCAGARANLAHGGPREQPGPHFPRAQTRPCAFAHSLLWINPRWEPLASLPTGLDICKVRASGPRALSETERGWRPRRPSGPTRPLRRGEFPGAASHERDPRSTCDYDSGRGSSVPPKHRDTQPAGCTRKSSFALSDPTWASRGEPAGGGEPNFNNFFVLPRPRRRAGGRPAAGAAPPARFLFVFFRSAARSEEGGWEGAGRSGGDRRIGLYCGWQYINYGPLSRARVPRLADAGAAKSGRRCGSAAARQRSH